MSAADDVRIIDFDLLVPFDLIGVKSMATVYRSDAEQSWKEKMTVYRQREAEYWSVRIAIYICTVIWIVDLITFSRNNDSPLTKLIWKSIHLILGCILFTAQLLICLSWVRLPSCPNLGLAYPALYYPSYKYERYKSGLYRYKSTVFVNPTQVSSKLNI